MKKSRKTASKQTVDYKELSHRHPPKSGVKESQMKNKLERLLRILYELNHEKKKAWYISSFAKEHHITPRTVQKDICFLNQCGYHITRNTSSPHKDSYQFSHNFQFFPSNNQVDNALLKLTRDLTANFDKEFVLSHHDGKIANTENFFYIKIPKTNPKTLQYNGIKMNILKEALESKRYLNIEYVSIKGRSQSMFFAPLKICLYNGFWYLIGFCDNDQIHLYRLRLDQIQKMDFPKEYCSFFYEGKPVDELLDEAGNLFFPSDSVNDQTITLEVSQYASFYFEKKCYFRNQSTTRIQTGLKVTCQAADPLEVFPVVGRWIPHVRIVSPKKWANDFYKQLEQYLHSLPVSSNPNGNHPIKNKKYLPPTPKKQIGKK